MARTPNGASSIYLGKDGYWHGRVTVGVKDDGRPDRRHVMGTQADVTRKVRALERQRDGGTVRKAGRSWTVEKWLLHWVENIAAPFVRDNTLAGYRVAVNVHLIPGLGKHRLDRLEPEHLEKLYVRMMRSGSASATAPIQAGRRWPVERLHAWLNGYGKLRRCTDKRKVIVELYLYLAATLVVIRRLIRCARSRYRWLHPAHHPPPALTINCQSL